RRTDRRRCAARGEARRQAARARARWPTPPRRPEALLLEERQVAARLRVPRRESSGVLGAERLPHARRPLQGRTLLRWGDAGDAADARRGSAEAPRRLAAVGLESRLRGARDRSPESDRGNDSGAPRVPPQTVDRRVIRDLRSDPACSDTSSA